MDTSKQKSDYRGASKKGMPTGLVIALSVAVGALLGSAITYSVTKPHAAPQEAAAPTESSQMPRTVAMPPSQQQFTPAPQPPGAIPPGKVWSAEHGHWHDAPAGLSIPAPTAVPTENK